MRVRNNDFQPDWAVRRLAYAAEDAILPLRLHNRLMENIEKKTAKSIYEEIGNATSWCLHERTGVFIDDMLLGAHRKRLRFVLMSQNRKLTRLRSEKFNNNSCQNSLQRTLFEKMGLPVIKKTPSGAASTNEVLQVS